MKTRVRPCTYDRYTSKRWTVEILDPTDDKWIVNTEHKYFWAANWKAHRLAQYSLSIKENIKHKFVRRLKDGDETE